MFATEPASIFYLTGFDPRALERLFAVAVPADGAARSSSRAWIEKAAARAPTSLERRRLRRRRPTASPSCADVLDSAARVGVEEDHLPYARVRGSGQPGAQLREPAGALVWACATARTPRSSTRSGGLRRRDTEVIERMFAELRARRRRAGGQRARRATELAEAGATDCHPLILFGANAANPHGDTGRAPAGGRRRDLRGRLGADRRLLGRTSRAAAPSGRRRLGAPRRGAIVREAQAAAIAASRRRCEARDVDAAQRSDRRGGGGHRRGACTARATRWAPRSTSRRSSCRAATRRWRRGNVLTIEPGLYAAGVGGIRLEDDVRGHRRRARVLSSPAARVASRCRPRGGDEDQLRRHM